MPTERFYRLPEDKKMSIRDAAVKEFVRVPFEKVSINQIIQNAEISRGSFYTYFEDKRDVLSFVFEDMKEKAQKLCVESLEENHGDFWIMMNQLFEYGIDYCSGNDILQLSKNTIHFQSGMGLFEENGREGRCQEAQCRFGKRLYQSVDKMKLNISGIEDFFVLLDMGMANLMMTIGRYYQEPESVEELRQSFQKKMELLRWGAQRNVQ